MSILESYRTPRNPAQGEFRDRSSKFLAYLFPAQSHEILTDRIKQLKKEHPKARHFCMASRFITGNEIEERTDDAGEPSGTAGRPILGVLQKSELLNCCCVVVRYFGGTKLGKPGLIQAYRTATEDAVQQGEIEQKTAFLVVFVTLPYQYQATFLDSCSRNGIRITGEEYGAQARIGIGVPALHADEVLQVILRETVQADRDGLDQFEEDFGLHLDKTGVQYL